MAWYRTAIHQFDATFGIEPFNGKQRHEDAGREFRVVLVIGHLVKPSAVTLHDGIHHGNGSSIKSQFPEAEFSGDPEELASFLERCAQVKVSRHCGATLALPAGSLKGQ